MSGAAADDSTERAEDDGCGVTSHCYTNMALRDEALVSSLNEIE